MTMLQNYITVAWRNLKRHRVYSFINIAGLSLGMACGLFIILYIYDESSYDKWWEDSEQLYRTYIDGDFLGQEINSPSSPSALAATLRNDFEGIESATRFHPIRQEIMFQHGDLRVYVADVAFADSAFFDVFSIPLLRGDRDEVLRKPGSVVISQRIAQIFFGDEDPLGQTLNYDNRRDYRVTGVMGPLPGKSHFSYDIYMSDNHVNNKWIENGFCTYWKLKPGYDPGKISDRINKKAFAALEASLNDMLSISPQEFAAQGNSYNYGYQLVKKIHLHSNLQYELRPNSSIQYLYILGVIGFLVLFIASINFINLVTARSASRSKEVGIRKVVGAYRPLIVRQFLTEAIIQSFIALVIALMIVELTLPSLNRLLGTKDLALFGNEAGWFSLSFILLALIVGVFSGSYPAFYLSSFQPSQIIKGQFRSGKKGLKTRYALVIAQFSISLSLIIGLSIMFRQLEFMQKKDLGFQPEQVVVVPIQTDYVTEHFHEIKKKMLRDIPGIISMSRGSSIPGVMESQQGIYRLNNSELTYPLWYMGIDDDFLQTLEIDLIQGEEINAQNAKMGVVLLNERAVEFMNLADPIGAMVSFPGDLRKENSFMVKGVVENFHTDGFDSEIKPMILYYDPMTWFAVIRVNPGLWHETLSQIEKHWESVEPSHPFRYSQLDLDFAKVYLEEQRLGKLFLYFTFLSICIACMGLFGLALYNSEMRTKEIGIRKVLGASSLQTWLLLTKEFGYLTIISIMISWPLTYFAMNKWLGTFVYRVEIPLWIFFTASGFALLIALITVSAQTLRTSISNPVFALRYE